MINDVAKIVRAVGAMHSPRVERGAPSSLVPLSLGRQLKKFGNAAPLVPRSPSGIKNN